MAAGSDVQIRHAGIKPRNSGNEKRGERFWTIRTIFYLYSGLALSRAVSLRLLTHNWLLMNHSVIGINYGNAIRD